MRIHRLGLLLALLFLISAPLAAQTVTTVAIYNDTGTWAPEWQNALPALLDRIGVKHLYVNAADVNGGKLLKNGKPAYPLFIVPGGWAPSYIVKLGGWGNRGGAAVKAYLNAGGAYLGFCAGAFAACDTVHWEGKLIDYPWNLFDGQGLGALKWNKLNGTALTHTHGTAVINLKAAFWNGRPLPAKIRPLLAGGPSFTLRDPKNPPPGYEVLATHGEDNTAAIVTCRYPTKSGGRVVLCSFHPAVLTDGALLDRDRTNHAKLGAGRDPDGDIPDWGLAAALIEAALGRAPRPDWVLPGLSAE